VGYETYRRLLEEAVRELREAAPPPSVAVPLGLDLRLPSATSAGDVALAVYRRIAAAGGEDDLTALRQELVDRFGPAPSQLEHLMLHQRLRRRAERLGLLRIRRAAAAYDLVFDAAHGRAHPTAMALLAEVAGAVLTPAQVLRVPLGGLDPAADAAELLKLLPAGDEATA
jgi:transcription-repair coupling factor (superfamily II helicase)